MTEYQVQEKLASGGNATVYVARALGALGVARTVALKKPHPHLLDDPAFEAAFRREATIAARLRHPNITAVYDVVVHEGVPCLAMELVDGATFAELIRTWTQDGGRDVLGAAIAIVIDAARGLHAVHELAGEDGLPLGLVHRDVSPQNVLVDRAGVAKLSDFGLAKALSRGEHSTTEGILKGKIGYLSPEYIRGEPIDRRSDIFALGIMLWESVTRRRLFRSEREPDVLTKILSMPIPKVGSATASMPLDGLDAILEKCLARKPGDRFTSAEAVADALAAFCDARGIPRSPATIAGAFPESLRERLDARGTGGRSPASPPGAASGPPQLPPPAGLDATEPRDGGGAADVEGDATLRDVGAHPVARTRLPASVAAAIAAVGLLGLLGAGGFFLAAKFRGPDDASTATATVTTSGPPMRAPTGGTAAAPATEPPLAPRSTAGASAPPRDSLRDTRAPGVRPGPKGSGTTAPAVPATGPRPNPYGSATR